jgi:hypothetical protein
MGRTHEEAKAILEKFRSGLKDQSKQRGYELLPKSIAPEYGLQTYVFKIPNTDKTYFFIVHTSKLRGGFWGISLRW